MLNKDRISINIYRTENGEDTFLLRYITLYPPRLGDEIRLSDVCYKIITLVWCYDEFTSDYERMNILIEKAVEN